MNYRIANGMPGHRVVFEGEIAEEAILLAGIARELSAHSLVDRIRIIGAVLIGECLPLQKAARPAVQDFGQVAIASTVNAIAAAVEGLTRQAPPP